MNRKLLVLLPVLAAASILANWLMRGPAPEPSLVSASPGRCVVDLIDRPSGRLVCELDGSPVDLPGPSQRWMIVEVADGKVVAGWSDSAAGHPPAPLEIVDQPWRVVAYPLPGVPGGVGVEAKQGHDLAGPRRVLTVRPAPEP